VNNLFILGGVVYVGIGGDLFVRGVVGMARWARIAPRIIAATFAAFATSSPELLVSITAALAQKPQIARRRFGQHCSEYRLDRSILLSSYKMEA
jgi:Ca2+/Na+ antiporter